MTTLKVEMYILFQMLIKFRFFQDIFFLFLSHEIRLILFPIRI